MGCLGRPIISIGLAPISSAVNSYVHSTFQIEQQCRIAAASWVRAYSANAERSASVSITATGRPTRSAGSACQQRGDRVEVLAVGPSACALRVCGCRGQPETARTMPGGGRRPGRPTPAVADPITKGLKRPG